MPAPQTHRLSERAFAQSGLHLEISDIHSRYQVGGNAVRALIDIGEDRIEALDALAKAREQSRAALIREAVDDFLARHRREQASSAFGLWGQGGEDGLAYQERMRAEW